MNRKIHSDDPRLTAYALGELGADDRAEIEAQLEEATKPKPKRAAGGKGRK